jgi:hypothetical protein
MQRQLEEAGSPMISENLSMETLGSFSPQVPRGRRIKFTPERFHQIKNLVERGMSREEIAEIIGVTVGSLQVTCSKIGISLRRPKFDNGVRVFNPRSKNATIMHCPNDHDGSVPSKPTEEQSQAGSLSGSAESTLAAKPQQKRVKTSDACSGSVAITIQYKGRERTIELPLTMEATAQLAWEAEFRDMRIGEFIAEIIVAVVKQDLFQALGKP